MQKTYLLSLMMFSFCVVQAQEPFARFAELPQNLRDMRECPEMNQFFEASLQDCDKPADKLGAIDELRNAKVNEIDGLTKSKVIEINREKSAARAGVCDGTFLPYCGPSTKSIVGMEWSKFDAEAQQKTDEVNAAAQKKRDAVRAKAEKAYGWNGALAAARVATHIDFSEKLSSLDRVCKAIEKCGLDEERLEADGVTIAKFRNGDFLNNMINRVYEYRTMECQNKEVPVTIDEFKALLAKQQVFAQTLEQLEARKKSLESLMNPQLQVNPPMDQPNAADVVQN